MNYPILTESTITPEGYYRHNKCGQLLDAKTVSHPVWWKDLGPCSGTGEVHTEVVPYCKTCGPEPSSTGAPVYTEPGQ